MLYVIGTYMLIARVIRTGRVPLDDEPAASPSKRPDTRTGHAFKPKLRKEKEMSETSDFGTFGRYTELPFDQMTPALEGIREDKGETSWLHK